MSTSTSFLRYRIATPDDDDAIHRLNYATFVEEIPQHPTNVEQRLVDRFHAENTYSLCIAAGELVGMVCGRCERPFSLDAKVADLDRHLPPHRRLVEIRLLAIERPYRKTTVFVNLVGLLARHFVMRGCDLAVISGTVRQRALYEHLGFEPFGARVGPAGAEYQPMYLTLEALRVGSESGRTWAQSA